jgi:hypothetical protein
VTLKFVGSVSFADPDPCTDSYQGRGDQVDEVPEVAVLLDVGLLEHGDISSENFACKAVGYSRQVTVALTQLFSRGPRCVIWPGSYASSTHPWV